MIYFDILFVLFFLGFILWVSSHLFSSIFHVPYVNSSKRAISDSLKLAGLKKGQLLLDLGCGRGDALIIAAKDFGAKAIGCEISPFPYLLAKIRTIKYRGVKVYRRDINKAANDIKRSDVIYLYLLNSVLDKVEDQIFKSSKPGTRIVSLAFKFPNHKPTKTISTRNLSRATKIYLYNA